MQKNNFWLFVLIGLCLFLVISPSLEKLSPTIGNKSELTKALSSVASVEAKQDLVKMGYSAIALSNILNSNGKIRNSINLENQAGELLLRVWELSFADGYSLQDKHPEVYQVLQSWCESQNFDNLNSQQVLLKIRELGISLTEV